MGERCERGRGGSSGGAGQESASRQMIHVSLPDIDFLIASTGRACLHTNTGCSGKFREFREP
jgi:hypothetical protein